MKKFLFICLAIITFLKTFSNEEKNFIQIDLISKNTSKTCYAIFSKPSHTFIFYNTPY
ncbi:MAG: hypothetical protein SOY60_00180 [Fusobacterium gastrosuis]|uniref:hypothetical protein n=1 Tax=Fusobacterium gastrosuis TaxID=1755100 RepID=UPI002A89BFDA|nr:hypothetical protein [Fusobacterium gastrosuis]MDY5795284.1 hypothetical protein [Fusobacterium gastrosuis]